MKMYLITPKQLEAIEVLIWGAKMTQQYEPDAFNALVQKIKTQSVDLPFLFDETDTAQKDQ